MFRSLAKQYAEAKELAASADEFKALVQEGFEKLVAGTLNEGETAPDLVQFQEILGRLLRSGGEELTSIDDRHTLSLVNASLLRGKRDELVERLRKEMVPIRLMLDMVATDATVKAALRDRKLSSARPVDLLFGARNLITILRDPKVGFENLEGSSFNAASALATKLEGVVTKLAAVLDELSPQRRASQNSQGVKRAEVEGAVKINRRCGEVLIGLYRLCGLDYHAERLRQRVRMRRRGGEAGSEAGTPPPSTLALQATN